MIEGVFNLRARVEGNDVGYNTIAATGPERDARCTGRATTARIGENELLLLDAGVEAESLYTADITRTLPISGTFTPEQRAIYELVLAAQDAAFAQCKPGNDFLDPNRAAMRVLAHGLERLGILASADEALRDENLFYKRYSLHNVSHMLGLDVHDCAAARAETYKLGALRAGDGADRRAGTVLPARRSDRAGALPRDRRAHRGRRAHHRDRRRRPLGGDPARTEDVEAWVAGGEDARLAQLWPCGEPVPPGSRASTQSLTIGTSTSSPCHTLNA